MFGASCRGRPIFRSDGTPHRAVISWRGSQASPTPEPAGKRRGAAASPERFQMRQPTIGSSLRSTRIRSVAIRASSGGRGRLTSEGLAGYPATPLPRCLATPRRAPPPTVCDLGGRRRGRRRRRGRDRWRGRFLGARGRPARFRQGNEQRHEDQGYRCALTTPCGPSLHRWQALVHGRTPGARPLNAPCRVPLPGVTAGPSSFQSGCGSA